MKPAPFDYHRPATLAEAISLMATCDYPKVLAGGQSMMAMMNMRFLQPQTVVDLNDLELDYIRRDGEVLRIGAMTRQRSIELSEEVKICAPLLAEVLQHVGHIQTRNRGTIGGSLCQLDPSAELPTACLTLDAEILVVGPEGERTMPMKEFPMAYMMPSIAPEEIVTEVRIPVARQGHGFGFEEFARRHGDFAVAAAAVTMQVDNGVVSQAAVSIAGLAPVPVRVPTAEAELVGQTASSMRLEKAASLCGQIEAMADVHATVEYRQHLAVVLASQAMSAAAQRALSRSAE